MPIPAMTRLLQSLVHMSRLGKQAVLLAVDTVCLIMAVWVAYSIRLGTWFVPNNAQVFLMLAAPVLAIPVFVKVGLYRSVIRYVGEQALWTVVKAMFLAGVMWLGLAFMTQMTGVQGVPRTVPVLYAIVGTILIAGTRFTARWLLWLPIRQRFNGRQVLIYGAGVAGRQLAASLKQGRDMLPIGFLDDDRALHGKDVDGLRVYKPGQMSMLLDRYDVHDVIVTLPSVSNARRREVVLFLEGFPVRVRILPAMADIASGRHLVNMVREVDIGDLLGRDAVAADPLLLQRCIAGKVVMVTGAGGSIGSELCRQIAAIGPASLLLLEVSEHALYQIDRHLRTLTDCPIIPCLGSVEDAGLVTRLLSQHRVQTIYHAAAYKHVPLVEGNVMQGVRNNIVGTMVMAQAAFDAGVERFVLISSDKAVRPTNVMGATKRWAELVIQDYAWRAREAKRGQCFCAVRFGNVLGSSGSVIPLFKEQIAHGGPITVTHPEVTRYFMSIHEAVELVIQAGGLANGGEVFLLDMGEAVKIIDLARNMIRLAGHSVRDEANPDGDIAIEIVGMRPGEKLYEELLIADSNAEATPYAKIMRAKEPCLSATVLAGLIDHLRQSMAAGDEGAVRALLLDVANSGSPKQQQVVDAA